MTPEEVEARVAKIQAAAYDPEWAHKEEDWLWRDVLETIAKDCCHEEHRRLAMNALKTREIKFERWYS